MASNNTATPSTSIDAKDSRWYFTAEQLANSPSRRQGINADQELSYRQQTAYLIQEMGQRLSVSQLCINTAIVYMHRFYAFHSFTHFHRNGIAAASLFLAAKVEEQPRKLEHVIKVAHLCLSTEFPHASTEVYNEQAQDLVFNENVLLQTLGFDVAIDHPHTHVVKTCHLVKACKDLAQTSYFLASNSLHLTSMCLQYKPTVVACFCIYLACKWSRWEIPQSTEGKHWFHYVDTGVTLDLLKQLTDEFLAIYEKSPARLKSKLNSIKALAQSARMNEPARPITDANGSNIQNPPEARRPESYSSHHRHHSSASSHHNHHSKPQLPPTESGDHPTKPPPSHKQQQSYVAASSSSSHTSTRPSRPDRPDRSDRPPQILPEGQLHPSHGSSKQSIAAPNLQRSSSSNRLPPHGMAVPSGTSSSSQRLPHTPHDANYHKNRNAIPASMNAALVSGHKSLSKDLQRSLAKDPMVRSTDPNKISAKHNSANNMSSINASSNLYPGSNVNATGVDLTRNVQSVPQHSLVRPFAPSNSSAQAPNYSQTISSRSNSSSSLKYDQSVQQQVHLPPGQKQSLESSFSQPQQTNLRQVDESSNIKVEQMEICSPTKYPPPSLTLSTSQNNPLPAMAVQGKTSSIFSPDWNEKVPPHSILAPPSSLKTNNDSHLERSSTISLNFKSNRDSPKKPEREKRSETPKKEKMRSAEQAIDPNKILLQSDKRGNSKKFLDATNQPTIPNIANSVVPPYDLKHQQALNLSGVKRPCDIGARVDEERDYKVRKVEPQSPTKVLNEHKSSFNLDHGSTTDTSRPLKPTYSSTVNGIETDPDLVRNLLKESLCTENKFMVKPENLLEYADIKPIDAIRDMETLPVQLLQNESPIKETIKDEPAGLAANIDMNDNASGDQYSKSKAEKKKKKDKHKHKEKDKSKDKEERKKHKKDKERSKDRDRSSGNELEQNHVKLTIPKEKLNLTSLGSNVPLATSELKIKIPKDRIRAELTQYQVDDSINTATQQPIAPPLQPSSLKIKISKDKIESYSHHSQHHSASSFGSSSSHHSHHSSKKKDRDRDKDRDKEKKRSSSSASSSDHNKQNGSGSGGGGNSGLSESSSSTSAATKNQSSSNKIQQYSANMTQLFGDLHDDESPSPPSPSTYIHQQPSQQQQRYSHLEKYGNQYQQQMGGNYYHNSSKQ